MWAILKGKPSGLPKVTQMVERKEEQLAARMVEMLDWKKGLLLEPVWDFHLEVASGSWLGCM